MVACNLSFVLQCGLLFGLTFALQPNLQPFTQVFNDIINGTTIGSASAQAYNSSAMVSLCVMLISIDCHKPLNMRNVVPSLRSSLALPFYVLLVKIVVYSTYLLVA